MSEAVDPEIKSEFEDATVRVKNLPNQPTHVLLKLYGLYKQANEGDVVGKQPSILNVKARAKWDSWDDNKGMSKEDAMKAYAEFVKELESS